MTPEEARVRISSVMYALKHGKIRATESGDITEDSVDRFIAYRERNAEERSLFLRSDLSAEETKRLRELAAARVARRNGTTGSGTRGRKGG